MLTPIRVNAPIKGWNTVSPIREMPEGFAARIENVWFDQAGGANRRPAQQTVDTAAPISGSTIGAIFEHYSIAGVSSIFCWCTDSKVYSLSGGTWSVIAGLNGVFTAKPKAVQMGNVMVVGDGTNVRTYNGTTWATPAGVNGMNAFCTYNGRVFGTGKTTDIGMIYYSSPISSTGATDWSSGAGGGFIQAYGALKRGERVVALAEYSGFLVALCSNSIILYQGSDPNDPATFTVSKVIDGIGCFSAHSVQGIGNDLMFLSNYGFKNLKEVLVRGDASAFESSFAINNYIVEQIRTGNITNVDSTFSEPFGVYLCTFGLETLAYHTAFNCWTSWNGLNKTLFTTNTGTTYTANNRLHSLSTTIFKDYIDGDVTGVAISWVVELPPFKVPSLDLKARWNRLAVLYEGTQNDTLGVTTWRNLNESDTTYDIITLEPEGSVFTLNSLLWTGIATTNPRNAWGTLTTGPSWGGGSDSVLSGDEVFPVVGRGELLSVRLENTGNTNFRLVGVEAFYNAGGLRK